MDMDCMKQRSLAMVWSNLPSELVIKISDHHHSFIDKLRLRCVCSSWRAALLHHTKHPQFLHLIPSNDGFIYLGIACRTNSDIFLIKRTIFLVSPAHNSNSVPNNSNNLNPFIFKTEKIRPNGKFCFLHPFFFHPDDDYSKRFPKKMNLSHIRITELEDEFVLWYESIRTYYHRKVVHMSVGNGDDYVVLTIQDSNDGPAMFRSVDHQWQIIDYMGWSFCDVISFNGMFYAVEYYGRTVEVSVDSGDVVPVAAHLERAPEGAAHMNKKYLVQLGKELILVVRQEEECFFSYEFDVYKLDRNNCKWVEISSLGDRILFLGEASTYSASPSDLKWFDKRGTHICYIDVAFLSDRDPQDYRNILRGYDMETKTDWFLDNDYYSKLFWPVPSWIKYSTKKVARQLHI